MSTVLCTVLTPVHSTRYPILGCQQQEAEVEAAVAAAVAAAVMVVIVLLYTVS